MSQVQMMSFIRSPFGDPQSFVSTEKGWIVSSGMSQNTLDASVWVIDPKDCF